MKNMMLCLILISAATGCDARGFFRIADVSIIDRDSGVSLTPHYYRGEYWVAGTPGARYAIEIRNRLGERLLAVTSVDGVNVVSGENAAWNQAGYVFSAGESYQITGWLPKSPRSRSRMPLIPTPSEPADPATSA
jgi:hypothetical protein